MSEFWIGVIVGALAGGQIVAMLAFLVWRSMCGWRIEDDGFTSSMQVSGRASRSIIAKCTKQAGGPTPGGET